MMGTDAWGFDIPIPIMAERLRRRDTASFFPAHYAGREREYCHMEKMANFGAIPAATGFTVACFPVKVHRASGGWCRPVAILLSIDRLAWSAGSREPRRGRTRS